MGSGVYHIETIKVKNRATGNVVVQFRLDEKYKKTIIKPSEMKTLIGAMLISSNTGYSYDFEKLARNYKYVPTRSIRAYIPYVHTAVYHTSITKKEIDTANLAEAHVISLLHDLGTEYLAAVAFNSLDNRKYEYIYTGEREINLSELYDKHRQVGVKEIDSTSTRNIYMANEVLFVTSKRIDFYEVGKLYDASSICKIDLVPTVLKIEESKRKKRGKVSIEEQTEENEKEYNRRLEKVKRNGNKYIEIKHGIDKILIDTGAKKMEDIVTILQNSRFNYELNRGESDTNVSNISFRLDCIDPNNDTVKSSRFVHGDIVDIVNVLNRHSTFICGFCFLNNQCDVFKFNCINDVDTCIKVYAGHETYDLNELVGIANMTGGGKFVYEDCVIEVNDFVFVGMGNGMKEI